MKIIDLAGRAARKSGAYLYRYVWQAYLLQILIWLDQGGNTVFSPLLNGLLVAEAFVLERFRWRLVRFRFARFQLARFGFPDETLSSVIGKNRRHSLWCGLLARGLDALDKNHSADAVEADEGGALFERKEASDD